MKQSPIIGMLLLFLLAACTPSEQLAMTEPEQGEFISLPEREVQVLEDGTKYIVHPSEILGGGPPQDGIPSIDHPLFVTVNEADKWVNDNELILALEYRGVTRAYPLQILVWHEIVNDIVAGDPVAITYCPLCGSGIAYKRLLNGEPVEFGTSGKLWNSNLVMYDRKTGSYWTQIDGIAILGSEAGTELEPLSLDTVSWGSWKGAHPAAQVLSQETGHDRDYGRDPYGTYYNDSLLFFPVAEQNDIIHPKTPVIGIELDGRYKAYREEQVRNEGTIQDEIGGIAILLEADPTGVISITRLDNGEQLIKERDFWFAWYAFHPSTLLYEPIE